ncbi:MAG: PSD1 and planctomycete cytochrome C domain-containing protein [Bryobacteraceae bacterium]
MSTRRLLLLPLLLVPSAYGFDPKELAEFFETRVRPVLAANCYACHTQSKLGGLRLDSKEAVEKGGNSGPMIVAGKPEESLLIQAVTHRHERLKMPPTGKLKQEEIENLTAWVKAGAIWPDAPATPPASISPEGEYVITPEQRAFWAFQPVRKPTIPKVRDTKWVRNPIDNFILAALEDRGLKPVGFADRRTLIRRATFDLTGLPPTPEEVDAFLKDSSPDAFAKVVDRLLASPRYGERWGRHWLDVARYADDRLNSTQEDPRPNAWRYRDWVIRALNQDMPYDIFVKAQIAGDRIPSEDPEAYLPGLGFYALSPEMQDERVDATTRGFLGLTVACAQCHDHKFDPIPTKDYYSLQGIFSSCETGEKPLADEKVVEVWQAKKKRIDKQKEAIRTFIGTQTQQLAEILAAQTAHYMLATRKMKSAEGLDAGTLERWANYLEHPEKSHAYLKPWYELVARDAPKEEFEKAATDFQERLLAVLEEKRLVDKKNEITLGLNPDRRAMSSAHLDSLPIDKFNLWQDFFYRGGKDAGGEHVTPEGVLHYGEKNIERFLQGHWKAHLDSLRRELASLEEALPPQYPFLPIIRDNKEPADIHIAIRGDRNNKGEIAPRRFLAILSNSERKPFRDGSGRLELAEAIADLENPLTSRVMVNRLWHHHFGRGIVGTPSNFGQLGERPSHPELLDYLAARFVENKWSIKAMHREIMLSATYALSAEISEKNFTADPENRFFWRANRQRMDAETMRDSMLFVSGNLDFEGGGPAEQLTEENRKRTVYGFVSRRKLNGLLALFDFPNPNNTSESRMSTNVPLQRLFMMNSPFVQDQAKSLAARLTGDETARIRQVYRTLYQRLPDEQELKLGLEFLKGGDWVQYARVLLSSNEFSYVN